MILSFTHRGLELFFSKGSYKAIPAQYAARLERILDRLDAAVEPEDMDLPGYRFHELKGRRKFFLVFSFLEIGGLRLNFPMKM